MIKQKKISLRNVKRKVSRGIVHIKCFIIKCFLINLNFIY